MWTGRASLQIKADRESVMVRGSLVRVSRGKMNFAAALLGTTAMSMLAAPAFAQDAAAQDAAADEAGDDAIVVTGIRSSLATALGEKRTSDNIVEVIQAEDIGKLPDRSEEHTSELQSLIRSSSAFFCLTKKKNKSLL